MSMKLNETLKQVQRTTLLQRKMFCLANLTLSLFPSNKAEPNLFLHLSKYSTFAQQIQRCVNKYNGCAVEALC